jgi:hypothetical protein
VCGDDATPGIEAGCWTGACIPLEECGEPPPPPACAELDSEQSCVSRTDCDALYEGIDCECTGDMCECAEWIFDQCVAGE